MTEWFGTSTWARKKEKKECLTKRQKKGRSNRGAPNESKKRHNFFHKETAIEEVKFLSEG